MLVILAAKPLIDWYPVESENVILAGNIEGPDPHPIGLLHTGIVRFVRTGWRHHGFVTR